MTLDPLVSLVKFAASVDARDDRIADIASNKSYLYRPYEQRRHGKVRLIERPIDPLKSIQRRVFRTYLRDYSFLDCVHAGVPRRSIFTAVRPHVGQPMVIALDLRDFYPSISQSLVFQALRESFQFGRDVARIVTELTTFRNHLPHGAPTSMALANLVMAPADMHISLKLSLLDRSARYTRWVDDLIISGRNLHLQSVFAIVAEAVRPLGLHMHRKKSKRRVMLSSQRQIALGLVLNRKPTIPRAERAKLRAGVHNFVQRGQGRVDSLIGRLQFLQNCHPASAARLLQKVVRASMKRGRRRRLPVPSDLKSTMLQTRV